MGCQYQFSKIVWKNLEITISAVIVIWKITGVEKFGNFQIIFGKNWQGWFFKIWKNSSLNRGRFFQTFSTTPQKIKKSVFLKLWHIFLYVNYYTIFLSCHLASRLSLFPRFPNFKLEKFFTGNFPNYTPIFPKFISLNFGWTTEKFDNYTTFCVLCKIFIEVIWLNLKIIFWDKRS